MNDEQYRLEMEEYYRQQYRERLANEANIKSHNGRVKTYEGRLNNLAKEAERKEYSKIESEYEAERVAAQAKQAELDSIYNPLFDEAESRQAEIVKRNERMAKSQANGNAAKDFNFNNETNIADLAINNKLEQDAVNRYGDIWDKQDAIENHEKLRRGDTTMLDPEGTLSKKEIKQQYQQALEDNKYNVRMSRDEILQEHDPGRYMQEQDDIYARQAFDKRNTAWEKNNAKSKKKNPTIKATTSATEQVTEGAVKTLDDVNDKVKLTKALKKYGSIPSLLNIGATISEFKESRKEGHGVVKSATKAGLNFAIGEALGPSAILFYGLKSAPQLAVSGVEGVAKMNRDMNSMKRFETFGGATFQDTQQLSTMRQSGMELAKMSQYNLQQTLMGTEAQHLHR
jgi:hypothetical protein